MEHITTTAFHPQSNGMEERLHRQIKYMLRARGAASEWESHLPCVLLGLCTAPKEENGISTAETRLGQQLVVPDQVHTLHIEGLPAAHRPPAVIPATKRSYAEVAASPASPLDSADWVYVRQGGMDCFWLTSTMGVSACWRGGKSCSSCRWGSTWTRSRGTG